MRNSGGTEIYSGYGRLIRKIETYIMELSPYIQGAITAVSFLGTLYFLPKKIKEPKRSVIAIFLAVAISLSIQFIIDCIAATPA